MPGEMFFNRGSSIFGMSYYEKTHSLASQDVDTNTIYVASSTLRISVDVFINKHHLKEEGTRNLLQRQLENASVWRSLMFSILENNFDESSYDRNVSTLSLNLRCDLFEPIIPDLAHAKNVRFLQLLEIKYEYWSPHHTVYFEDLFETLQYSLTSLIMNLEFKYPFVFSYYGKQLVKINYKSLIKNSTLLATPLDNSGVPDHNKILATVLQKLQRAILYEFNILNVMKECEIRPWQAKSCRKNDSCSRASRSRKSIKSRGFDLCPLRVEPAPASEEN